MTRRFLLVTNPSAGSSEIVDEARRALRDVEVAEIGDDLGEVIDGALEQERVIVAGGGDGTVSAVAQHMVGRGVLGILPAGTLNHFARDLGIGDAPTAIETLASGEERLVDCGRLNDRVFVNNVTLGLYPDLLHDREEREDRIGRWPAMLVAAVTAATHGDPVLGSIAADGDRRALSAWIAFVGNNRFSLVGGRVGKRVELSEGILDVWLITADPKGRAGLRAWDASSGGGYGKRRVRTSAAEVEIRLAEARRVASDGEDLGPMEELHLEMVPEGLRVLAPSTER